MSSLPVFGLLLRRRDPTNLEKRPLCVNKEIKKILPCETAQIIHTHTREKKTLLQSLSLLVLRRRKTQRGAQIKKARARKIWSFETSHVLLPRMLFLKLQHNQTKPPTLEFAALLSSSLSTLKIPRVNVK